jgi:hypothetical protein
VGVGGGERPVSPTEERHEQVRNKPRTGWIMGGSTAADRKAIHGTGSSLSRRMEQIEGTQEAERVFLPQVRRGVTEGQEGVKDTTEHEQKAEDRRSHLTA